VSDRRNIAGTVPRGLHPKLLGKHRNLARRAESACLRNVHPNVVDQLLGDQRLPLMRAVEELSHRDGGCAVLPDLSEVPQVLRRKRVFQKEHAKWLRGLAELDCLVRCQALVHVVQQLDLLAEFAPANFEQLQRTPELGRRVKQRLVMQCRRAPLLLVLRTVARHAGQSHLHAHMAPALFHILLRVSDHLVKFGPAGVCIRVGSLAALAARKLIHGHAGLAALDVPQRLVDAADGVVQDRPVFPVRAVVARLPDVFDAVSGLAQQEGLEVLLDRGLYQVGPLGERRTAIPVEPVLVGRDLHDGQAHSLRFALDDVNILDARRRQGARGTGYLLVCRGESRCECEAADRGGRLEKISTLE
jgi:hypothetical protein